MSKDDDDSISQWEKAAGALAVNVPSMIEEAITLHRLLVADEVQLYGHDDEWLVDQAACDAAAEREIKAFRILARMPCMTAEEAQIKLAYFMEEPRPRWFSHMERLTWEAYIDDEEKGTGNSDQSKMFMRSLYVNGGVVDDG
jgi:hypothetical protein